jgi:hypothetical protein
MILNFDFIGMRFSFMLCYVLFCFVLFCLFPYSLIFLGLYDLFLLSTCCLLKEFSINNVDN